jgi:hypothetical protein
MRFQIPLSKKNGFRGAFYTLKSWYRYYLSVFRRSVRFLDETHSHLILKGHVTLPKSLEFEEKKAKPRGKTVDGKSFSYAYDIDYAEMPASLMNWLLAMQNVIEMYFADEVIIVRPTIWRNLNIPHEYSDKEIYSDTFHQDLVYDPFNMQLFCLLDTVTPDHGPLEYLDYEIKKKAANYYIRRDKRIAKGDRNILTGKKGDLLLLSTGSTLHRASVPEPNLHRDMLSIPLFPKYTNAPGISFEELRAIKLELN